MIANFLSTFVGALIGAGGAYAFILTLKPEKRRPVAAVLIEVLSFALGAGAGEIVFGVYPVLHGGWRELATRIVLIWLIFLPGCYIAARLRLRRNRVV